MLWSGTLGDHKSPPLAHPCLQPDFFPFVRLSACFPALEFLTLQGFGERRLSIMTKSKSNTQLREHRLRIGDLTFHYLEWGQPGRPAVLLLHGYLDIAYCWSPLGERLRDAYHIIAPDFRGHGDSDWCGPDGYLMFNYIHDWIGLVNALGWARFSLVGHSMGANCASLMAGAWPERIDRLILVEGFGVPVFELSQTPHRVREHVEYRLGGRPKTNKVFDRFEDLVARIRYMNTRYSDEHSRLLAQHGAKQLEDGR